MTAKLFFIFFNHDLMFSSEGFVLVQLHKIIGLEAGINKGSVMACNILKFINH